MSKYMCTICGFVYDESMGLPSAGIAPGTAWSDVPDDWVCPICGATKSVFKLEQKEEPRAKAAPAPIEDSDLRKLTVGELSALCSNFARGCEKQYLQEESKLFSQLADYFQARTPAVEQADADQLLALLAEDLNIGFEHANEISKIKGDRGAQRALVWSEKVSRMVQSVLLRYKQEGTAFLENADVYVCTICGFLYIGDSAPESCPVCKVPSWKFEKIDRR